jgi:F420-dependent oxidoreductase-like protein
MRLGYSIAGTGLGPEAFAQLAAQAESLGYESIWSSEVMGADPIAMLGWIAARTKTIGLGSAVLQISGRSAVSTAASAATLARLSGGRFRLGLGSSGPQVTEGWHGQRYDRPLARTRDYVAVLRLALAGEPIDYRGATLVLPAPDGDCEALPLLAASAKAPQVPIYLAGLGEKAIALAGEIADGLITIHTPPEYLARAGEWLRAGAGRGGPGGGGRALDGFDLAAMVLVHVDDDLDLARDMVRPALAIYLGGMGTASTNFYNRLAARLGYAEQAERIQKSFLAGDLDASIGALSDDLVDAMTICGPPWRVRRRLAAYRDAGTTTLIAGSAAPSMALRCEQLELLADVAIDSA